MINSFQHQGPKYPFTPIPGIAVFGNPAKICFFKVKNRNTRKKYEISSKLTIKTPIVDFGQKKC